MKTKEEVKILSKIKVLGKFKITHQSEYDGRRQTVALLKINNKYYQGCAQCSHKDRFDRKLGRVIALGRALDNYNQKKDIPLKSINNLWRFKEDREVV